MDKPLRARILILARADAAKSWAQILSDLHVQIWCPGAEVPQAAQLDLILTDGTAWQLLGELRSTERSKAVGARLPAVVAIGEDGPGRDVPADVRLPADVTPRELRLACGLMLEIVRLRRALKARSDAQQGLFQQAMSDPLTGLPNRRAWEQTLGRWLAGLGCFALAILDLDHFKQVNDSFGHAAGDAVLRKVGSALSGHLRREDFVARLGGDEFGLLARVADRTGAGAVVERLRRVVPAGLAGSGLPPVTASAGTCFVELACLPSTPPSANELFAAADAALRTAKCQGRDRMVLTGPLATGH